MGLANDNWYDFTMDCIYRWKARWIEVVVASPIWTTMIVYYIEADKGHLMNEAVQQPQHRHASRGNAFSFHMPWNKYSNL